MNRRREILSSMIRNLPSGRELRGDADDLACGFVLFRMRGSHVEYLLLRHHKGGHWTSPKGHPEGEEHPLEAAVRETGEECGVLPERILSGFMERIEYPLRKGRQTIQKRVVYFLGEAPAGAMVFLSFEHVEAVWASLEDAISRVHSNFSEILHRADAFLKAGDGL